MALTLDQAVQRINRGIGYRPAGNALEPSIQDTIREAQRDLEKGKTLPKFLLQEDATLSLLINTHTVALPTGFIREDDENLPHFFPNSSTMPVYLVRRFLNDAILARTETLDDSPNPVEPVPPSIFVIRRSVIDFITTANKAYTLIWSYYKAGDILTSASQTNIWLNEQLRDSGTDWLIGEAGYRVSIDLGNADFIAKFDKMRQAGRAACFGETIAAELASGPLQMGANL